MVLVLSVKGVVLVDLSISQVLLVLILQLISLSLILLLRLQYLIRALLIEPKLLLTPILRILAISLLHPLPLVIILKRFSTTTTRQWSTESLFLLYLIISKTLTNALIDLILFGLKVR